ncbi:hypothetical protein BDZ89DRAFT_949845, partial [Hymenopellis radicata]
TVRVWNAETGKKELMLEGHTNSVTSASFSHDDRHIVSSSTDSAVRVWNVEMSHSSVLSPPSIQAWRIQDDGWLVSLHQERLLWLPSTLMPALRTSGCQLVISRFGDLTIDFSVAHVGKNWIECYTGHC